MSVCWKGLRTTLLSIDKRILRFKYFVVVFFFSASLLGQADILIKKGSKFYYQDKEYHCKELLPIYEQHSLSLDLYSSGLSLKRKARRNTYVSLGLFVGGLLSVAAGAESSVASASLNFPAAIGGLAMASGIVLQFVMVFQRIKGGSKLKKARRYFNIEMIKRHGYKEDVSISFAQTSNGIGFAIAF